MIEKRKVPQRGSRSQPMKLQRTHWLIIRQAKKLEAWQKEKWTVQPFLRDDGNEEQFQTKLFLPQHAY